MIGWQGDYGELERIWWSGRGLILILSRHSLGGTEENHEKLNQDSRSPGPRYEPGTSRVRSRSVNYSTAVGINAFHFVLTLFSSGIRRGGTWPRGYTPCWQVYANKSRVMPFIPTKSVACMSTSWLLGNVYTAKSRKGKKRNPDALKLGLVS
jgi:hypothetical protein